MKRLADWRPRLIGYLATTARREFSYGHHDCALFWAGAVEAMTGVDLAQDWRGKYANRKAGLRMLRKAGYADPFDLAARTFAEIPPAFAQVGDLAVMDTPAGPACGVVQGSGVYVLGMEGLALMSMMGALRAFRVI